jgi:hypothetical protein
MSPASASPQPALPAPTVSVSPEQVAFFHENRFLAIEAITTSEELERLRERGDQFDLAGSDEEGRPAALPQILSPSPYGAPAPWHQDEAYWNPQMLYRSLSVWMPLQPATLENGCLQFIPGSHRWEILEHQSIGGDTRVHGLEVAEPFDRSAAVPCPLPPGGATFHLNRTMHYAGPNNSEIPRRAYIIGFGLPTSKREGERRFPWNERKQTARDERARTAQS